MTDWTSLSYVVVDVEGNGQQPPELVEVAVVPIRSGHIGEPQSWLVRPTRPIRFYATRIHGLTNTDVADCPLFGDVKDQVLRALEADALVAHNAHVDVSVLQRQLGGWKTPEVFDTLPLARRLVPGLPSYKLGYLVEAFSLTTGLPDDLSPHRAGYDVLVTARLFGELARIAASLEALRGQPAEGDSDDAATLF